ncbi:MAG TPA: hypothetical protein VMM92_08735, partial [Thermoanaerobaculia bacterium]|nr:hypothetical protein [Thermoanaerobaculia bacterium]
AKPFAIMALEVRGAALSAAGKKAAGLARLKAAAALEAALDPPSGPPDPAKPACELYGEALLEQGKPQEAARQFEAALARTPNRSASLLGALRAASRTGDRAAAGRYAAALSANWREADSNLPGLSELQSQAPAR